MAKSKIEVPEAPFEIIRKGLEERFPADWFKEVSNRPLIVGPKSVDTNGRVNLWIRNYGQVLLNMEESPFSYLVPGSEVSDENKMWRREYIGRLKKADEAIREMGYDPRISSEFLKSDAGLGNLALAFQMYQPVVGKSSVVFDYVNRASETPVSEQELVDRIVVGFIPWTFDLRQNR